ncbi:MAG: CBS domain-containing protein [Phycisphaeraceae bacterium]
MATARDLLAIKGNDVYAIEENRTVLEATQLMNSHQVGCAVVTEADSRAVAGIFTERDVLRRVVAECRDPGSTTVGEVMTRRVVCCTPDTAIRELRKLSMERRVRHLPVLDENDELMGLISMGDINAWDLRDGQVTIRYMQDYIHGRM